MTFSSPDKMVPQGVVPPAQLPNVPCTRRPVGSASVFTRSLPAAGPVSLNGVYAVIRRLRSPSRT